VPRVEKPPPLDLVLDPLKLAQTRVHLGLEHVKLLKLDARVVAFGVKLHDLARRRVGKQQVFASPVEAAKHQLRARSINRDLRQRRVNVRALIGWRLPAVAALRLQEIEEGHLLPLFQRGDVLSNYASCPIARVHAVGDAMPHGLRLAAAIQPRVAALDQPVGNVIGPAPDLADAINAVSDQVVFDEFDDLH
jgi:hypothetical protein